jgi:hypothetical protein
VRVNGFVNRSPNQPPGRAAAGMASSRSWHVHPAQGRWPASSRPRRPMVSKHAAHRAKCQWCAVPPQGPGAARSARSSQQLAGAVPLSLGAKRDSAQRHAVPFSRSDDQPSPPRCRGDCAVPGRQASLHGLILARWRDLGYPAARPDSAPAARNPSGALSQRGWRRPASALARPHHQRPSQPLMPV